MDEDNILDWEVAIFGPPETIYQGAYFKALMRFSKDYPYSPPTFRFLSKIWHPNIYENGDCCISILHAPSDDPQSGELPCERWNPTQNARTVLLSVISLLNEPNVSSPANVDASVSYRKWKAGKDNEYETIVKKQVALSKVEAQNDGVTVPTTLEAYLSIGKSQDEDLESAEFDAYYDFGIEDYDDDDSFDEDEGENESNELNDEDSKDEEETD